MSQVEVAGERQLRSLVNEAGRQFSYYQRQDSQDLAIMWSEIEAVAFCAKQRGASLLIGVKNGPSTPIIKHGEQVQQLPKPNVIKAFQ
jgi:hypothetical protein